MREGDQGGAGIQWSGSSYPPPPWGEGEVVGQVSPTTSSHRVRTYLSRPSAALSACVPSRVELVPAQPLRHHPNLGGIAVDTQSRRRSHSTTRQWRFGWRRTGLYRGRAGRLSVADGEFVAIVGPTGCGKSTLLNVAAGLLKPAAGAVTFSASRWPASTGMPAICFRPMRCFPGRPRSTMSPSGWRSPARRARGAGARAGLAHLGGARRVRRPLSAHAVGRAAQARRPGAGADPRSEDPADGRAVRPARRPDPADHGQSAAGTVERRPQGGAVRHPRSRGGDRAGGPRRDHVGGPGARIIGDWRVPLPRPRDIAEVSWSRRSTSCIARSGAS